jgi:hypothetical protein
MLDGDPIAGGKACSKREIRRHAISAVSVMAMP